jgi:ADP-heptose:LPS heptosyltransferase
MPGVNWYSLQFGPRASDAENFKNIYSPPLKTFADTAWWLNELDLLISVDTSVVHLAGAMGYPVWTLLPTSGDWRWMVDREDSPWYPTMRLWRQKIKGDWAEVIERVRKELIGPSNTSAS